MLDSDEDKIRLSTKSLSLYVSRASTTIAFMMLTNSLSVERVDSVPELVGEILSSVYAPSTVRSEPVSYMG